MSTKLIDVLDAIDHRGREVVEGEMGLWVRVSEWGLVREALRHSPTEAPRLPPSDSLELIDGNELHALQRDKALLDWCEKNLTIIRDIGWLSGKDLRAAIDSEIARRSGDPLP